MKTETLVWIGNFGSRVCDYPMSFMLEDTIDAGLGSYLLYNCRQECGSRPKCLAYRRAKRLVRRWKTGAR